MSDPKENQNKDSPENLFRMLDDLLSHTNKSRRLFLVFIASALFFGPVALVLGGILIGHPMYNIRQLEVSANENQNLQGYHVQIVSQNGTIIREMPIPTDDHSHRLSFIFMGIRIFIVISIVFAGILLFIAIKEYKFFSKWNQRFLRFKAQQDKVDKELED